MTKNRILSALLAVAVAASTATAAVPPIAVDTRVKVSMTTNAVFRIRITVEPHPANRTVCLHADLNGFRDVEKGCFNAGAKTEWRNLKLRDVGDYDVYATVERNDNTTQQSAKIRIVVRGPGYEEPSDPFGSEPCASFCP